ncbi:hypothetical protein G6F56_002536 [Rhizopus delemar]|nr:hypothetical protein G6F56_002536 [Rhizopus delemar]
MARRMRENLALWFAWAFWHEHLEIVQKNKSWANEIEWMICAAEERFGVKFLKGYNADVCCIRLNLDPIQAIHRPLVVYCLVYFGTLIFNLVFLQWLWGFTLVVSDHGWGGPLALLDMALSSGTAKTQVAYWSRNTQSQKTPLVFIHGVGAGLMGYVEFIHQLLMQSQDRAVFLIELPYVSMHLVEHVPSAEETVQDIKKMLHSFGYSQAVFVSHSMGTGVASWVSRFAPDLIAGSVMVDPICFLLHHHHVAFNFIHRIPKVFMEYILCYGVSRELHISHFISRHLQWFETIHFADQLKNTSIFLSEKDRIIGALLVHQFLKEREVDVHIMPTLEHAQFLIDVKWKQLILENVDKISRKSDFLK